MAAPYQRGGYRLDTYSEKGEKREGGLLCGTEGLADGFMQKAESIFGGFDNLDEIGVELNDIVQFPD